MRRTNSGRIPGVKGQVVGAFRTRRSAGSRPIFIMGTQRSGTTLMRLLLDSHEHIAVGFETGFMRAVRGIKEIPDWNYGKDWYRRYGFDEADINSRIRAFYSGIFSDYARAQGKRRWGEKTPLNLRHMAEMAEIFPEAQFLCMVRHVGAVVASMLRWNNTYDDAVRYWVTGNARFNDLGPDLGPNRFLLCRYEDLVTDPRTTLQQIMDFLGEPWSDNLLRHHEVQAARGGKMKVEGGTRRDRPLDASGIDAWRDRLDPAQMEGLSGEPAPLLRSFGYEVDTAVPVGPPAVARSGARAKK